MPDGAPSDGRPCRLLRRRGLAYPAVMPADPPVPHRRFTVSAPTYRRVVAGRPGPVVHHRGLGRRGAADRLRAGVRGLAQLLRARSSSPPATSNQAIEQVNRLFTGLVSLSVIAAVLGSLRRRPYRRDLVWLSLGLVAGVVGQIVLGGITVLVDLHPAAVAGHFVLSMVLVADAVVLLWRAGQDPGAPPGPRRPAPTSRCPGSAVAAGAACSWSPGPWSPGPAPTAATRRPSGSAGSSRT